VGVRKRGKKGRGGGASEKKKGKREGTQPKNFIVLTQHERHGGKGGLEKRDEVVPGGKGHSSQSKGRGRTLTNSQLLKKENKGGKKGGKGKKKTILCRRWN